MSKNVTFKLNGKGVREFLRSEPVKGMCEEYANAIAGRANGEYEKKVILTPNRYISTVEAADGATRRDNLKNNTLLKALGGGA